MEKLREELVRPSYTPLDTERKLTRVQRNIVILYRTDFSNNMFNDLLIDFDAPDMEADELHLTVTKAETDRH